MLMSFTKESWLVLDIHASRWKWCLAGEMAVGSLLEDSGDSLFDFGMDAEEAVHLGYAGYSASMPLGLFF